MKDQKVWLITGATRGFGLEITKAVLQNGDIAVATVRSQPEKLRAQLNDPAGLHVVVLDVTNEQQVKKGVEEAILKTGRIDVLVNNAGYGLLGATEEVTDEEVRKQYDTNVFGLLNVTRAVVPHMRERKLGHIINISSVLGYGAVFAGFGLYGSTKYAIEGITEGLAQELQPFNIHVTAVAPGIFRTDFASTTSYVPSKTVLPDYVETVGRVRNEVTHLHGNQPGDPARLAQVMIKLVASNKPPLHLPVGKDAVAHYKSSTAKISAEVEEWEAISSSTDYAAN